MTDGLERLLAFAAKLRKLYDDHPKEFEIYVALFQMSGKSWRENLPPLGGVRGKPRKISEETLAQLLAEYRNRQSRGESRGQFLEGQVERRLFEAYSATQWQTLEAVEWHLKQAEKKFKREPDFANSVNSWEKFFTGNEIITQQLMQRFATAPDPWLVFAAQKPPPKK